MEQSDILKKRMNQKLYQKTYLNNPHLQEARKELILPKCDFCKNDGEWIRTGKEMVTRYHLDYMIYCDDCVRLEIMKDHM